MTHLFCQCNISSFSHLHLLLFHSLNCFLSEAFFQRAFSLSLLRLSFLSSEPPFFLFTIYLRFHLLNGFIYKQWANYFPVLKNLLFLFFNISFERNKVLPHPSKSFSILECPLSFLSDPIGEGIQYFGESHFETFDHGLNDVQIDKGLSIVDKCLTQCVIKEERKHWFIQRLWFIQLESLFHTYNRFYFLIRKTPKTKFEVFYNIRNKKNAQQDFFHQQVKNCFFYKKRK